MKYSDFYLAFEDKFRGSSKDVNKKLVFSVYNYSKLGSQYDIYFFCKLITTSRSLIFFPLGGLGT